MTEETIYIHHCSMWKDETGVCRVCHPRPITEPVKENRNWVKVPPRKLDFVKLGSIWIPPMEEAQ